MMPYASRTGTRTTLAALRAAGWGLLVSAAGVHRTEGFETYAIDNGAWSAHTQGRAWDARAEAAFLALLDRHGRGAQFVVVPDVVAGGLESLRLSEAWLPRLEGQGRVRLVPVQDGMVEADVRALLGPRVGIFLGGGTPWKLHTMAAWGALARERGCWYHVGRVNTGRRIRMCAMAGADSFDGSSVTKFPRTLRELDNHRRQGAWRF